MLKDIKFYLCDLNKDLINEWKLMFSDYDNFNFYNEDILQVYDRLKLTEETVGLVSPANSYGELSGGIDLIYLHRFGYMLQEIIQSKIINEKHGELIVGDAFIVDLPDYVKGYFIVAPTMRVPMNITNTVNIYLAFRAILISVMKSEIKHIIIPGLGTGIGKVPADVCANQMYHAYNKLLNPDIHLDLLILSQEHLQL